MILANKEWKTEKPENESIKKKEKSKKNFIRFVLLFFCHRKTRRKTGIPVSGHLPDRTDRGQPPKPPDGPDIAFTAPKKDRASRK